MNSKIIARTRSVRGSHRTLRAALVALALVGGSAGAALADANNFIRITELAGPDFVLGGPPVDNQFVVSLTLAGHQYYDNTLFPVHTDSAGPGGFNTPELSVLFYAANSFLPDCPTGTEASCAGYDTINWRDPGVPGAFNTLLISTSGNRGSVTFVLSHNEPAPNRYWLDSSFGGRCSAGGVAAPCPILSDGTPFDISGQILGNSARFAAPFTATFH
ncbi:MAG TPA: hypothetical protein VGC92_10870, partial [Phenylobacterium sp.]